MIKMLYIFTVFRDGGASSHYIRKMMESQTWGRGSIVQQVPGMQKILRLIPSTTKRQKKKKTSSGL
jgi:hypothetical protein